MAVLSRVVVSESTVKGLIHDLTNLYLKHRTKISRAIYLTLLVALIKRIRDAIAEQRAAAARQEVARRSGVVGPTRRHGGQKRVELNRDFFTNLFRLIKIVIPGWKSKEMRLLVSHTVFLILRTLISLYVAALDGKLVSDLVKGRGRKFLTGLVWWMLVAIPATFTNSMVSRDLVADQGDPD